MAHTAVSQFRACLQSHSFTLVHCCSITSHPCVSGGSSHRPVMLLSLYTKYTAIHMTGTHLFYASMGTCPQLGHMVSQSRITPVYGTPHDSPTWHLQQPWHMRAEFPIAVLPNCSKTVQSHSTVLYVHISHQNPRMASLAIKGINKA